MRFPPKSYSKDLESLEVCGTIICTIFISEKMLSPKCPVQMDTTLLGVVAIVLHVAKTLTGFKTLRNNSQQFATTCNRVCKQT